MNIFQSFERAVYINLDRRPDRRMETESELHRADITAQRFAGIEPDTRGRFPNRGYRGGYESHWTVIQRAMIDGMESVLVMEDDVRFAREDDGSRLRWLESCGDWDMLFFYSTHGGEVVAPGIVRIPGTLLAHCYAVHQRAMPRIVAALESNDRMTIDNFYLKRACRGMNVYATTPDLVKQRASRSDVTRRLTF